MNNYRFSLVTICLVFVVVGVVDSCAHQRHEVVRSMAFAGGICVEDLTGAPVDEYELTQVLDQLSLSWEKAYPGITADEVLEYFRDHPVTALMVPPYINCVHTGPGTWPGQPAKCIGLWPVESELVFLSHNHRGLHCTALAHELSHVLSYEFLHEADRDHTNRHVWSATGIVKSVEKSLGEGCK